MAVCCHLNILQDYGVRCEIGSEPVGCGFRWGGAETDWIFYVACKTFWGVELFNKVVQTGEHTIVVVEKVGR
jgi:hypothetical protein